MSKSTGRGGKGKLNYHTTAGANNNSCKFKKVGAAHSATNQLNNFCAKEKQKNLKTRNRSRKQENKWDKKLDHVYSVLSPLYSRQLVENIKQDLIINESKDILSTIINIEEKSKLATRREFPEKSGEKIKKKKRKINGGKKNLVSSQNFKTFKKIKQLISTLSTTHTFVIIIYIFIFIIIQGY